MGGVGPALCEAGAHDGAIAPVPAATGGWQPGERR